MDGENCLLVCDLQWMGLGVARNDQLIEPSRCLESASLFFFNRGEDKGVGSSTITNDVIGAG